MQDGYHASGFFVLRVFDGLGFKMALRLRVFAQHYFPALDVGILSCAHKDFELKAQLPYLGAELPKTNQLPAELSGQGAKDISSDLDLKVHGK